MTTTATTTDNPTSAALEQLDAAVASILEGDNFQQWLDLLARLHSYSWSNTLLILTQRPSASLVAGYRRFQSLGRQVRKGEKGIRILAPVAGWVKVVETDENGNEVETTRPTIARRFRVVSVFDIAQTDPIEGKPDLTAAQPPMPAMLDGESAIAPALDATLTAFLRDAGVTVETGDTGEARGWYNPTTQTIRLSDAISGDQRLKTYIHEAAHWHADHRAGISRADAETVAEASAYVVLRRFGIDTTGHSAPYIAQWAADTNVLRRNLAAIQKTATALIDELAGARPATA